MDEGEVFEPTILEATRRYPLLVAMSAIVFAILGFGASHYVFNDWVAEAGILIQDPSLRQVFDTGGGVQTQPERYVESQVAILESREMAANVLELVDDSPLTVRELLERRSVGTSPESDLILVSLPDPDADMAIALVNAYGTAYVTYREDVTNASFEAALNGLDSSIAAVDEDLDAIDATISEITAAGPESEAGEQLRQSLSSLIDAAPSEAVAEEMQIILNQLQSLQILSDLETESQILEPLLDSRNSVLERRSELVIRRDQLLVDAALASDGVLAVNAAAEAERSPSVAQMVAIGLLVGGMLGVGVAFYLTRRNRLFETRSEPEITLEIPLLAEIPTFGRHKSIDEMPVVKDPSSPEAEAFRFASSSMIARLNSIAHQDGDEKKDEKKTVVITSALLDAGKTTVALNSGLSAATRGRSVLIFDADFGDPALTRAVAGDPAKLDAADTLDAPGRRGVTDVLEGSSYLSEVVVPVKAPHGNSVDVLTRGTAEISAIDFFQSTEIQSFFHDLKSKYDHIIIDAPPLLQVAYASSIVALADAVVVVIPHESRVQTNQELTDRLTLLRADVLGYVYNKAPRRAEMFERRGSMLNPLGTGSNGSR